MVDEPVIPVITVTQADTPITPAPAVDNSLVTSPVVVPEVASVVPVVPATAPVEAPKAPEAAPATLLAQEPIKAPETPPTTSIEAPSEALPNEGDLSAEPAPSPTYDPFVLPEGVTLEADKVGEFTKILSELELGKGDHALTQMSGQKLIDFHINELKNTVTRINEMNQTTWNNQVNTWKDEFLKDPVYGNNRFQTTVDSALEFIRTHGGSEEEQQELRTILDQSGLGNHKAVIRTFAKAMTAMKEGQPLVAQRPPSAPKSKVTTMYGNS